MLVLHARVCACMGVCVCVLSFGLFSVVSLIMRKLFNVCLPVERGRECETVIAEREREKNLREGVRQTLLLMQYDLSDDDTHSCLAREHAGTYAHAWARGARLPV